MSVVLSRGESRGVTEVAFWMSARMRAAARGAGLSSASPAVSTNSREDSISRSAAIIRPTSSSASAIIISTIVKPAWRRLEERGRIRSAIRPDQGLKLLLVLAVEDPIVGGERHLTEARPGGGGGDHGDPELADRGIAVHGDEFAE